MNRTITFRERTPAGKLRWLADKLERQGDDELIRFGIVTALIAVACDLDEGARIDGNESARYLPGGEEGDCRGLAT